jgi:hypothetical protein
LIIFLNIGFLPVYKYIYKFYCQCSRLETGVLQLAEDSHLIVDETQLDVGTLNSVGVENARLLKNLMELQKVIVCLSSSPIFLQGHMFYYYAMNLHF